MNSTFVDFFLMSRLEYLNHEENLESYTNIQKYLQLNPSNLGLRELNCLENDDDDIEKSKTICTIC